MTPRPISVGITTRNRPQSLNTCVASLALAADLIEEVFIFDDASEPAATVTVPTALAGRLTTLRDAAAPGYIVGRNRLIRRASAPFVLLLDDDTRILSRGSITEALDVMRHDSSIAAVGFAQAEADGRPWPAAMQPAAAAYPCIVPSFIGFAHLLRRDVSLALGGYRDSLRFYGEEKEFCLRLLDAGYRVAYLPGARVGHLADPVGRDQTLWLRYVIRNDCLSALYNEPLTRVLWLLPARLVLYFRMRRAGKIADRGGVFWILRELARQLGDVRSHRRPVKRSTIRRWRALRASPPPLTFKWPMRANALVRAGLNDWKRRSPASFWRVRNGAALARWCWTRARRHFGSGHSNYDDAFWTDQDGDWEGVAELVRAVVNPRSIVDVGCGQGLLMEALRRQLPAAQIVGLDDSEAAIARARKQGLTVVRVDIAGTSGVEIDRVASSLGAPDLAICLEVAEHLPSWHSAKLLRLITAAPTVLFSAAHPNQGGVLHVNERPAEYWQARFAELGYELGARDREFRARLRMIDLPWWYADNAHVFERATGGSWHAAGS